jgi:hypothetical protein
VITGLEAVIFSARTKTGVPKDIRAIEAASSDEIFVVMEALSQGWV